MFLSFFSRFHRKPFELFFSTSLFPFSSSLLLFAPKPQQNQSTGPSQARGLGRARVHLQDLRLWPRAGPDVLLGRHSRRRRQARLLLRLLLRPQCSLPISLSFAAAVASAAAAHPAFTHVSTHTHGTLAYKAPEVISQGRVGRPADVFSLAVLSAEVFSGWRPFRALPLGAVVHAIVYSHERQGRGREKQREKEERKEKKTHFLKNSKLKQNSKLGNTGRPCLLGARQSSRTSSAAAGTRTLPRGRGLPPSWPL
jgi:serine/threonine protein kinase